MYSIKNLTINSVPVKKGRIWHVLKNKTVDNKFLKLQVKLIKKISKWLWWDHIIPVFESCDLIYSNLGIHCETPRRSE